VGREGGDENLNKIVFCVAYTKDWNKNEKRKICFKNRNCDHVCRGGQLSYSFP
jgi:hypothetical protein